LRGVGVTQGQDPALGLVEPHTVGLSPSIQPVQTPPQSLMQRPSSRIYHLCQDQAYGHADHQPTNAKQHFPQKSRIYIFFLND